MGEKRILMPEELLRIKEKLEEEYRALQASDRLTIRHEAAESGRYLLHQFQVWRERQQR